MKKWFEACSQQLPKQKNDQRLLEETPNKLRDKREGTEETEETKAEKKTLRVLKANTSKRARVALN